MIKNNYSDKLSATDTSKRSSCLEKVSSVWFKIHFFNLKWRQNFTSINLDFGNSEQQTEISCLYAKLKYKTILISLMLHLNIVIASKTF